MDEAEVDQLRRHIQERIARVSTIRFLLAEGYIDEDTLAMFVTGKEGWQLVDLNPAHRN